MFFFTNQLMRIPASFSFMFISGDHFRFGSVFTHKKQPNRKKKKTRNRTEIGPNRPVSVRFLMPKTEKTYMHFFRIRNGLYYGILMNF